MANKSKIRKFISIARKICIKTHRPNGQTQKGLSKRLARTHRTHTHTRTHGGSHDTGSWHFRNEPVGSTALTNIYEKSDRHFSYLIRNSVERQAFHSTKYPQIRNITE